MKISELPEPYRSLARLRETQPEYDGKNKGEYLLIEAFEFDYTPEGWDFWWDVDEGKLPPIPEKSLKEIGFDQ